MRINKTVVGVNKKPFIIAEMSGNHNQSLDRALDLVDAAAEAGADAVKLQTYTADTMTLNINRPEFTISDKDSLWFGRHLYELYHEAHTPWEWHKPIMDRAKEKGIICFSTPFDDTAVDFLEELDVPAYKIASFENTDVRLIKKVAQTGKPLIISTGMASADDLRLIVSTIREAGCEAFALLKCTSAYPAPYNACNIKTIPALSDMFNCLVGLSDHTMGIAVPVASVALGACVIEKHFTLSRGDGGVDSAFSLDKDELKALVSETYNAWQALGKIHVGATSEEKGSATFRRTLYICEDIEQGQVLTEENLRTIRPGYGLPPKFIDQLIGKKVVKAVMRGTPMSWDLVE